MWDVEIVLCLLFFGENCKDVGMGLCMILLPTIVPVYRALSQEFGVVRVYQTYIFTKESRWLFLMVFGTIPSLHPTFCTCILQ